MAIISILAGGNFKLDKIIDLSAIAALQHIPLNWTKSVDLKDGNLLCGLRNGTILEIKNAAESEANEPSVLMQSHFEGETWGLSVNDNMIITSGDDNRIMLMDANTRKYVRGGKISDKKMKDPSRKSNASTMS